MKEGRNMYFQITFKHLAQLVIDIIEETSHISDKGDCTYSSTRVCSSLPSPSSCAMLALSKVDLRAVAWLVTLPVCNTRGLSPDPKSSVGE